MAVDDNDAVTEAQVRLRGDVELLRQYGEQHPAQWGGLWFEERLLCVGFTRADDHREAVIDLVQHPQDVRVVQVDRSARELDEVRQRVERVLQGHRGSWTGVWTGAQHVHVALLAHALPLAARLWTEHDDALVLTVPGYRNAGRPDQTAVLGRLPATAATGLWPEGLTVELALETPATRSGELLRGALVLRAGDAPVAFSTGQPLAGELLDGDGHRMNDLSGFRAGVGVVIDLAPGQTARVTLTASTNSASARYGPLVPAGVHRLIVPVPVQTRTGAGQQRSLLVAGPFSVEVTPAPGP